jgi:cytochrome c peroxidase
VTRFFTTGLSKINLLDVKRVAALVLVFNVCAGANAATHFGLSDTPSSEPAVADPALVSLGKQLFFDPRLSANGTVSCATCHIPEQGFTQNQVPTSTGFDGRSLRRNSSTLLNIGYQTVLFHDGRESTLENQVWSPLLSDREMANPSVGWLLDRVAGLDDYDQQFQTLLGDLDMLTLGVAIAAYERTLIAADSPFDRWFFNGDETAMPEDAIAGFAIFNRHGCTNCHLIEEHHARFEDAQFHNTGIGFSRSMLEYPDKTKSGPDNFAEIGAEARFGGEAISDLGQSKTKAISDLGRSKTKAISDPGRSKTKAISDLGQIDKQANRDLGRFEVTGHQEDRWRYRTPTLRNIALTSPYMHDGSLRNLDAVIAYYLAGGSKDPKQDPRLLPFTLTFDETQHLLAFLESLTGHHIDVLINSASE